MSHFPEFGCHGDATLNSVAPEATPNLCAVQAEVLPPLQDLLEEGRQMRREIAAAEQSAYIRFLRTMQAWHHREVARAERELQRANRKELSMAHRSRLRKGLSGSDLECMICGCTQNNPCLLGGGTPCHWVTPGLCSNPECIQEITAGEEEIFLNGDEGGVSRAG